MRIAITCHAGQGGSGVVATELAIALGERGHEVHIVSMDQPFRLSGREPVTYHRVSTFDYPLFKYPPVDLCYANKLAEVIIDHDIEIVHAHYAVPHAINAILADMITEDHPAKVVTTLHGTDITLVGSHRDFYRVCLMAMRRAHGLTTVSDWLKQKTYETFDLQNCIKVIPNFVDCERFSPIGRAAYPSDGRFELIHASNFRPVKRVTDIVRVFQKVRESLPEAQLTMYGEGPDVGMACELAGELGLCGSVKFAGSRRDIENAYREAHLFLLLSDYESFGLSALEAMASATPAVASRAGGLPEVIEDGVSGILCPVGQIDQFAERIVALLQDQASWEAMSAEARNHAHAHFCRDKIIPQYEAIYEKVMNGNCVG